MKQVILVRKDLKMPKGKLAAQVAHASVHAVLKADKKALNAWLHAGATKIVVWVHGKADLSVLITKADKLKLPTSLIMDAGKTFFNKPTMTCGAIGPGDDKRIDTITGNLSLL